MAHNGSGIAEEADLYHQSRYEALHLIDLQMFIRSTETAFLPILC